ncbi:MAG: type II toxin-antitoxin system MqsA family antitoxin [Syntrophaceae bacterium]|nr:type II toxin-antitoxin system MqsA family antitoxin [Syntrophaceae bacterium]
MICANCFEHDYQTTLVSKEAMINGRLQVIPDLECEKCPGCGDTVFTHEQSLAMDKKRINMEFSSKPTLTPQQLKLLRQILKMSLEEICDLLHIGRNSYGRWERGEVDISPSMNLLIHQFIERFPEARVNLIETEMQAEIEKARPRFLSDSVSLGEFVRNMIAATKITADVVGIKLGIGTGELEKIENNEIPPENIPIGIAANIVRFFRITMDNLKQLLENTLKIQGLRSQVSFMHARTPAHGKPAESVYARSMNKILEKYVVEDAPASRRTVNPEYLKKVGDCLR